MSLRKYLSVPALLETVRNCFEQVTDPRSRKGDYPLGDVLMSGLAVFALKDPSLLAFDQLRWQDGRRHNLRTLYGVTQAPCDSQLRAVLDGVDPLALRPAFHALHQRLQQQGVLASYRFLGKYLVSFDGTGVFSSGAVHCPDCCCKTHQNGSVTYYHQLEAAVIVHPEKKTVLPLYPEAITTQDGETKNDCEHNAARRLIPALRADFPRLEMIALQDALACNGPHIRLLKAQRMSFIITCKPRADSVLLNDVLSGLTPGGKTVEFEVQGEDGMVRGYRFANDVPLNGEHRDIRVNFVDYWETHRDGTPFQIAFVTDLPLTADNVAEVIRAGRSRWKVENETFNTLKNLGYNLTHNYGHGQQHLATVFGMLMLLSFLIDQIQEACCPFFQAARGRYYSRKLLWEHMRGLFRWFKVQDWQAFWSAIIWEGDVRIEPVRCRSG